MTVQGPASDDTFANKHPTVLVVDDSPIDRQLAGGLLQKSGNIKVEYAENGVAALEFVRNHPPDLVLTDMMMPEMGGLELVEAIRKDFPRIPTILMTAHGSEETAMTALQRGAASYVPKRVLSSRLVRTLEDVLAVSRTDREQQRLVDCWQTTRFEFLIENDASLIPPLVSHLQQYLTSVKHCDQAELVRVGVALHEALRNAIHHGNLELSSELRQDNPDDYYRLAEARRYMDPYAERRVHITATESKEGAHYTIRDQGPGFNPETIKYDTSDYSHLERPSGRGLFLIQTFMDEVTFNENGNEITMIHRRDSLKEEPSLC